MRDDDIEDDDLQDDDDIDNSNVDDVDEMEVDEEPVAKTRKKTATEDEQPEGASLEAKQRERDLLAVQMAEFLARGGQVQQVDDNVKTDLPKKPGGKYGSQPI